MKRIEAADARRSWRTCSTCRVTIRATSWPLVRWPANDRLVLRPFVERHQAIAIQELDARKTARSVPIGARRGTDNLEAGWPPSWPTPAGSGPQPDVLGIFMDIARTPHQAALDCRSPPRVASTARSSDLTIVAANVPIRGRHNAANSRRHPPRAERRLGASARRDPVTTGGWSAHPKAGHSVSP